MACTTGTNQLCHCYASPSSPGHIRLLRRGPDLRRLHECIEVDVCVNRGPDHIFGGVPLVLLYDIVRCLQRQEAAIHHSCLVQIFLGADVF